MRRDNKGSVLLVTLVALVLLAAAGAWLLLGSESNARPEVRRSAR